MGPKALVRCLPAYERRKAQEQRFINTYVAFNGIGGLDQALTRSLVQPPRWGQSLLVKGRKEGRSGCRDRSFCLATLHGKINKSSSNRNYMHRGSSGSSCSSPPLTHSFVHLSIHPSIQSLTHSLNHQPPCAYNILHKGHIIIINTGELFINLHYTHTHKNIDTHTLAHARTRPTRSSLIPPSGSQAVSRWFLNRKNTPTHSVSVAPSSTIPIYVCILLCITIIIIIINYYCDNLMEEEEMEQSLEEEEEGSPCIRLRLGLSPRFTLSIGGTTTQGKWTSNRPLY